MAYYWGIYASELIGGYVGKRLICHFHPLFILHLPQKELWNSSFFQNIENLKNSEKRLMNGLVLWEFMPRAKLGDMWEKDWYVIFIPYSYYIYQLKELWNSLLSKYWKIKK